MSLSSFLPQYITRCFRVDNTKKKLCIVHIGMPKTGSSALQDSLFRGISDSCVSYANLPVGNHSAIIYSLFAECPEKHHANIGRGLSLSDIEKENFRNEGLLIEGFTRKGTEIEIISGEDIFHLTRSELVRLKIFLDKYFFKTIIVGYVRSPKSFMESAFQQLVKYHNLSTFDFDQIYPHYRSKLEKFDEVFNRSSVFLWKYDPSRFPDGDVTQDFCSKLNININRDRKSKTNITVSKDVISLLFLYNNHGKIVETDNVGKLNYDFVEALKLVGNNKFKFSNKLMLKVFLQYREDILWAEGRLGEKLHDMGEDNSDDINSAKELLEFSLNAFDELKQLLANNNIRSDLFVCTQYDILEMMYELKKNSDQVVIAKCRATFTSGKKIS